MFTKINIKYYYSVSFIFYNFIYFIFLFVISKLLSLSSWGEISLLLLIAVYANILTLGIGNSLSIRLPYYIEKNDLKKLRLTYSIFLISVFYILFIYTLFSVLIDYFYIKNNILIFSFYLVSNYIVLVMRIIARSYDDYRALTFSYFFQAIIFLLFIFLFMFNDFKNVFLTLFFSNLIASLIILNTYKNKIFLKMEFDINTMIELINLGFPLLIASILYSLLFGLDRFFIKEYYGLESVGIYSFASLFFKINMVLITLVNTIYYPRIIKSYASKNYDEILKLSKLQQSYSFFLVLISSVIIYIVVEFYLFELFPKFSTSVDIIVVFLITTLIYPFSLYTTYFIASGNQKKYMLVMLASLIINIILNIYFLSYNYPLHYIALSTFISILFNTIFIRLNSTILLRKRTQYE